MQRILVAFSSSILVGAAGAQTTHVVGPGGFATINAAIAAAAPGDVIRVPPGDYPAVSVSIGVVITSATGGGGGVDIDGIIATVPAGQTLHLVDLNLRNATINGGRVTLEWCRVPFGCVAQSCEMMILSSQLGQPYDMTTGHGLSATNCVISATTVGFFGCQAVAATSSPAKEGLLLNQSTLVASGLHCRGGVGVQSNGPLAPQPAVRAINSEVWISDSQLWGGALSGGTTPLACPVDAQVGRLARCTLLPNCTPVISTCGPLLGIHQPIYLLSQFTFTLNFQTEPNGLVAVYCAQDLGNIAFPGAEQPILLDLTTTFHLQLLTADATGLATGTWGVPPGLTNQTFFFQAVGTANPWQLSPVAGGVVR